MDKETLNKFRSSLLAHRDELNLWMEKEVKKELQLGGTPFKDILEVISELETTLEKLDNGHFGQCDVCQEDVNTELLEMDYTACVCIEHYSEKQRRSLERDLELAAKVQRQLLPCCSPSLPEMDIAMFSRPAQIVSGDYYDFFAGQNGTQGMAIADVMGKGLSASMLMSNLQATLRIIGPQIQNPSIIAQRLNELFVHNLKLIRFITIFIGVYEPKNNILHYCNAGHHPPFMWKAATNEVSSLLPTGPAIGLSKEPTFTTEKVTFEKNDLLLLYTDGILELRNKEGKEFGEERLIDIIKKYHSVAASQFISEIQTAVNNYSSRFHDDISLMVLQRKG